AFAAYPGWAGNVPALIFFVLWNRVEVPKNFACSGIHCQNVAAWNVALAARAADVDHAVIDLWGRCEPISETDGVFHVGITLLNDVKDNAGLTVLPESGNRFAGFRVERKQK